MNEQEKALQGMIEFCQWLIPNVKQLGLENSKSVAVISNAKTPDELVQGVNGLYQELGEEQFTALTQAFQESRTQSIPKKDGGGRLEYLISKMNSLNRMPTKRDITDGGLGYVTYASSDRANYTLNTDGRDSLMWMQPGDGTTITLSNSGPNKTWKGYDQKWTPDGPEGVELPDSMTTKIKNHMFKKLGVK